MDTVLLVISLGLAALAVRYGYLAVREARAARREEHLRQVAGIVAELGTALWRAAQGDLVTLRGQVPVLQGQLAAAIGSAPLPATRKLTTYSEEQVGGTAAKPLTLEAIQEQTRQALDEVAAAD